MATGDTDQLVQYAIFTDADDEVPKFLQTLGFTTEPLAWRSKKLERDKFQELHTCLQKDYNGGLFLYAAQIFHECIIQTSGRHIFLRGDRDKVKRARGFLESDEGPILGASYRQLLETVPCKVRNRN